MAISNALIGAAPDQELPDRDLSDKQSIARDVSRVNNWFDYFNINIQNGREDLAFAMVPNGQWDKKLFSDRTLANKACFEINYIYSILASLIGKIRKNTPEFKVFTIVDENNPKVDVDQDEIDLRDNLLRQIAFDNKVEVIFQTAGESALIRGFGAIFVKTAYDGDFSFHQKIIIEALDDPNWAFFDPAARKPDKSDGRYCGYMETYSVQEFKDLWPHADASNKSQVPRSFPSQDLRQAYEFIWRSENWIRIAHTFVKINYPTVIYQMSDGRVMTEEDALKAIKEDKAKRSSVKRKESKIKDLIGQVTGQSVEGDSHVDTFDKLDFAYDEAGNRISRETIKHKIIHRVMSHDEILEENEWPCSMLPGIFVDGHSHYVDGKQFTKSFHRTAKDSQRFLNYVVSESATNLMNSHKSLFIGTPENFEGFEDVWRNPSNTQGALPANRDSAGQLPMNIPPPEVSPSYIPLKMQAAQDIQNTLGYFAANQGQESNETSGVAITNRAKQGDLANFVYYDNLNRAIEQTFKVSLALIPSIYDTTREIIVRNKNGQQKKVQINIPNPYGFSNDLTKGNFNVEVTVGSNYETQKAENMEQLMQLLTVLAPTNPSIAMALSDLIAANTDLENTTQIVDRLRGIIMGMTPQQILQHEMGVKPPPPQPPSGPNPMELQMQEMQNEQKNQQQRFIIDQQKNQNETQKNDIENRKITAGLQEANIKAQTEIEKAHIAAEAQKHVARQKGAVA